MYILLPLYCTAKTTNVAQNLSVYNESNLNVSLLFVVLATNYLSQTNFLSPPAFPPTLSWETYTVTCFTIHEIKKGKKILAYI